MSSYLRTLGLALVTLLTLVPSAVVGYVVSEISESAVKSNSAPSEIMMVCVNDFETTLA
jgi:hypothetical protein